MKRLILIVSIIFVVRDILAEDLLQKAEEYYKKHKYLEAIQTYNKIIKTITNSKKRLSYINPWIYYNLANSYLKADKYGYAIYYYKKALLVLPRNADIRYNLNFAINHIKDIQIHRSSFVDKIINLHRIFSISEIVILFLLFYTLFIIFITLHFLLRNRRLLGLSLIFFMFSIGTLYLYYKKEYQITQGEFAVVIKENAQIMSGPDFSYTKSFILPQGSIVKILEKRGNWIKIQINTAKGWVNNTQAKIVKLEGLKNI